MQRRNRFNLALVAGTAILGALLWLTRPAPQQPAQPLIGIPPDDIARIEIQRPGEHTEPLVLARADGSWRLAAPVRARADADQVRTLLRLAQAVPERRYAAGEIDRAQAGLNPPAARLQFNDRTTIAIGGRGPLGSTRYLQIGDTVLLADTPSLGVLDAAWTQWIDPRLIAADANLAQLRLPGLTLIRTETGGWRVEPGGAGRGADAAQRTVDTWRHARALSVVPSSDREPVATVELVFADGRTRRLGVIARQPELVLRDARLGADYHLAANKGPPLLDMRHPESALGSGADTPARSRIPLTPEAPAEGSSDR